MLVLARYCAHVAGKLEKQSILGLWQMRYFQVVRTMGEWYLVYYKNHTVGFEYEKRKDADPSAGMC